MKLFTLMPYMFRRCINKRTPTTDPGTLPLARASTTLRRTVPLRKWSQPDPILVTKLKTASEPTARIGGTFRTKIKIGNSRTPPPSPVIPIKVPTNKPIKIVTAAVISDWEQDQDDPATPMKPSRSKCRMISCAASSGVRSAVLMTTSASLGSSYGSEIPVNSLMSPARALA